MLNFDNIFKIEGAEFGIEEDVTLVSHAHSDHLPTKFKNVPILCSDITRKMMELKKHLTGTLKYENPKVKMLEAGHILGSKMFFLDNRLLYTGDLNPIGDYCGKARPVKTDTLIIEATYGHPRYSFPDKKETIKALEEYLKKNNKALITCSDSSFGKPQEICAVLDKLKIPFNVTPMIAYVNSVLDLKFKSFDSKSQIIVSDGYGKINYGFDYKRVHLSGWGRNGILKKGFVFSSHGDYETLIEFVRKCNPKKVYTHHGFDIEFAAALRKLGFDASPLREFFNARKQQERQTGLWGY